MLSFIITKGGVSGVPEGEGGIVTNELPDALTWLIFQVEVLYK